MGSPPDLMSPRWTVKAGGVAVDLGEETLEGRRAGREAIGHATQGGEGEGLGPARGGEGEQEGGEEEAGDAHHALSEARRGVGARPGNVTKRYRRVRDC